MSMELVVPASPDLARKMPSSQLYALVQLGQVAREILDERVSAWTQAGWTQRQIAEELGCASSTVSDWQARLGVKSRDSRGGDRFARSPSKEPEPEVPDSEPEDVEPDEVLPPAQPTDATVINRLARTAEVDEQRACDIWARTLERHGPDATPEQVAEVAAEFGEAPAAPDVDMAKETKRCTGAIGRAIRKQDSRAARQALAIWRAHVWRELDRIARMEGR